MLESWIHRIAWIGIAALVVASLRFAALGLSSRIETAPAGRLAWTGVAELPRLDDAVREVLPDPEASVPILAVDDEGQVALGEKSRVDLNDPRDRESLEHFMLLTGTVPMKVCFGDSPTRVHVPPIVYASARAPAECVLLVLRECRRVGRMPLVRVAVRARSSPFAPPPTSPYELVALPLDDLPERASSGYWNDCLPSLR